MLPRHVTLTAQGVYKYRRRTPQELKEYIESTEILRSLGKNSADATKKASELTQVISEATQLTQLSSIPSSVIAELLEKHGLTATANIKTKQPTWLSLSKLYLDQSNVTAMEFSNRQYFFLTLMPSIFKALLKTDNPELTKLTYDVHLNIRNLFLKLPKKNIQQYRAMNLDELVYCVHKGTLKVSHGETTALDTINKNLKRIKSILIFAQNSGLYTGILPNMTIENKTQSKDQRKAFTPEELQQIEQSLQSEPIYPIVKILRYTGMRTSELLKCSLSEIEGVLCFDLRTPTKALKTLSSHRVIPVHPSLKESVEGFQELLTSFGDGYITKRFSKLMQRHLQDTKNKSLYSLRHTFATNLIAKGVQPEIVSELMGHSHSTMTMNRYVKGYPVRVLKEAIERL